MTAAPLRSNTSIRVVALISFVVACKREPAAAVAADAAPVAVDAAPAPIDAPNPNKITISVVKPRPPGSGLAKRCAIGGKPLTGDCVARGSGIAIDGRGTIYIASGTSIHRYKRGAGDDCVLAPAGAPLAMPPPNPRPQRLDGGPIYMRSGGAAWHPIATSDAVYAHDFLTGLYRIDRGKPEPACLDVFGYDSIVQLGKRLLVSRKGIEQLALRGRGKCSATSAGIDDKARGALHVAAGRLYHASRAGSEIVVYDGATATKVGDDATRICSIAALTTCGDGACVLDNNCPQLIQLAADGSVTRTISGSQLFDQRPYSLQAATTTADGTVLVLARHRDKVGDQEICEAAVYAVPGAAFAP